MRVTEGFSDIDMAEFLVQRSRPTIVWMRAQGIRWILMFARQSYEVEGKHHFWGGLFYHNYPGGAGLMAGSVFAKAAGESAAVDLGLKAK